MRAWVKRLDVVMLVVVLGIPIFGCGSDSGSSGSSSSSSYMTPEERYDAKYGEGAYQSDKEFMNYLQGRWDVMTGQ